MDDPFRPVYVTFMVGSLMEYSIVYQIMRNREA